MTGTSKLELYKRLFENLGASFSQNYVTALITSVEPHRIIFETFERNNFAINCFFQKFRKGPCGLIGLLFSQKDLTFASYYFSI